MSSIKNSFLEALVACDAMAAREIADEVLAGENAFRELESLIVSSCDEIGNGWMDGRYALSQVYMSGKIVEHIADLISARSESPAKRNPTTAMAVLNDSHLLGIRIVMSVLKSRGYSVLDYGKMEADEIAEKAAADGVKILLVSTLMLNSALKVKDLRAALSARGLDVKICVGGAPFRFDPALWREVGADAFCESASNAPDAIDNLAASMTGGKL